MTDQLVTGQQELLGSTGENENWNIWKKKPLQVGVAVLVFILVLACCAVPVLLCLAGLGILPPDAPEAQQGDPQLTLASVVAMFGVLMTGIFVFVTISTNARAEDLEKKAMKSIAALEKDLEKSVAEKIAELKQHSTASAEGLEKYVSEKVLELEKHSTAKMAELEKHSIATSEGLEKTVSGKVAPLEKYITSEVENSITESRRDVRNMLLKLRKIADEEDRDGVELGLRAWHKRMSDLLGKLDLTL